MQLFAGCSKSDADPAILPGGSNTDNNKAVGASAKELLTAGKPKLVIEINYMPGYQLQSSSVNNLITFFTTYLNKPGGVQVVEKQVEAAINDPLSITDLALIEQKNRTAFNSESQVAIYFLVTNGGYSTPNVLGVAYRNTSMCLFGKTIQSLWGRRCLGLQKRSE